MTTDVLADVLATIRLTGSIHFDFDLSPPWVAEAPTSRDIAGFVMPGARRAIEYHLMARGGCWANAIGDPAVRLSEGDLIVFPQGDQHVLSSAPGMRATPDWRCSAAHSPLPIVYEGGGGGADRCRILCGFLGCDDRPFNPLLAALRRMILVSTSGREGSSSWLATLLHLSRARDARATARRPQRPVASVRVDLRRGHPSAPGDAPGRADRMAGGPARPVVGQALGACTRRRASRGRSSAWPGRSASRARSWRSGSPT
jgi:hypothetical protein